MTLDGVLVSDKDLLSRCRDGEEYAWSLLLDRYERLVFSIPRNYGLDREDSADVAQGTFTDLLQSLEKLRDDSAVGGWLAVVAKRRTWKVIGRTKRERTSVAVDGATKEDRWHHWIDAWSERNWVVEGLLALGQSCRDLLVQLYLDPDEPSYREISSRLDLPMGSIGPSRARCLDKLRGVLQEMDELG